MIISTFPLLVFCFYLNSVHCVTPSGELKIRQQSEVIYVAPSGNFGAELDAEADSTYRRLVEPSNDKDGCAPEVAFLANNVQFYLLVARGNCSFEDKAFAAEAIGADGIVIYNSLEGIYQGNEYASDMDFECNNGFGFVNNSEITYPPYSDEMDAMMPSSCTGDLNCASGRCLLTNNTDGNQTKVCCAWDLYITMGGSDTSENAPSIPAVFIRMQDADTLMSISQLYMNTMEVSIFSRSTSSIDFSSVVIWMLAVCTVALGASFAAEEDKVYQFSVKANDNFEYINNRDLSPQQRRGNRAYADSTVIESGRFASQSDDSSPNNYSATYSDVSRSSAESSRYASSKPSPEYREERSNDGSTLDISSCHAVGFVVVSSMFLILLYFVDLYSFVTYMYLASAAMALAIIIIYPFVDRVVNKFCGVSDDDGAKAIDSKFVFSAIFAICIAMVWFFNSDSSWAWILQDIMGVSVCLMFLSVVRIPNLKIATILLSLAFCYDVFFVFISPYVFSSSVMIDVATGNTNTNTHNDENFCEKYPDDADCQTNNLPMLLKVPAFSTYYSSESILGLGDIVLPGLLVVWTARYDIRRYGSLQSEQSVKGYFSMVLLAYGLGLMAANYAVSYFEYGQPALLYIVPLTLGSVLFRSFKSETLLKLWEKLPPFKPIAIPLNREEQQALLSQSDVVEAVATWNARANFNTFDSTRTSQTESAPTQRSVSGSDGPRIASPSNATTSTPLSPSPLSTTLEPTISHQIDSSGGGTGDNTTNKSIVGTRKKGSIHEIIETVAKNEFTDDDDDDDSVNSKRNILTSRHEQSSDADSNSNAVTNNTKNDSSGSSSSNINIM